MVDGLPSIMATQKVCQACMEGKQHKIAFPTEATFQATKPLELVHSNVCKLVPTTSMGGSWYSLLLVDDFSRMTWVHCLAKKSRAFDVFKTWRAKVERETRKAMKTLRTDRGESFVRPTSKHATRRQGSSGKRQHDGHLSRMGWQNTRTKL